MLHELYLNISKAFSCSTPAGSKSDTFCDSTRLMSSFASGLNRGKRGPESLAGEQEGGMERERAERDMVV